MTFDQHSPKGQESLRTAIALLRAYAAGDVDGLDALLYGTEDMHALCCALLGLTSALTGLSANREYATTFLDALLMRFATV